MKKVVAYIISDIEYAIAFEWIADSIDRNRFNLVFILLQKNQESTLGKVLSDKHNRLFWVKNRGGLGRLVSGFQVFVLLLKIRPEAVHCHMRTANFLGLFAAFLAGIKNRIYTRHYATQNHRYYPKAVKTDKLINRLATRIVAPSKTVEKTLIQLENVEPAKVKLIHHGFDLSSFKNPDSTKVDTLKNKLNLHEKSPVVGVIARYLELKGIQYIIPAFAKFLEVEPDAVLVLANASGNYGKEIKHMLDILPKKSYREVVFEKDLVSLYGCFDYFVHAPIDTDVEAFGQVYVEALAAGIPSIFTLSGIANEFIENEKNALVVPHQNADAIYQALNRYRNNHDLVQSVILAGQQSIAKFDLASFIQQTEALYE